MRIAVHGFAADGVGSGAGAFPLLMASLLEAGHEVHFYGVRGFTEPKSLERYPAYRFIHFKVPAVDRLFRRARRASNRYVRAAESTASHFAYHRGVIRRIERELPAYDVVLCVDALNLWRSRLPVLSWPQSPPQTEWAAFREPRVARSVWQSEGLPYFTAVHAYRAYRWMHARVSLPFSDLIVCGSPWARDQWLRFGLRPERAVVLPYPIDVESFASTSEGPRSDGAPTFLWLGRAVPRKRLDLFLAAFELVRQRHPEARARLVGDLGQDPASASLLARFRNDRSVSIDAPVGRAQIPTLLSSIDVLVQPSLNENFGFSVAEAFAAGRPVVLGASNGTASYGGAGVFLFSDYEPAAVAHAMERAAAARRADPEGLAAQTRATARAYLDPQRVAKELVALMERTREYHLRSRA